MAFAKNPELVPVKTRLSISLGQNQAALIYTGLLEDCLEQLKSFSGADLFLACYPDRDGDFFKRIQYRHGISLIDQKGEDLGERILDCIGNLLDSHNSV
ncbi:MAG: hypothetical protein K8F91_06700, partial [Candidatus Obscuribacterales bacterium]|nr:hypothetical protein [Candidatus Obscuribacterales bacterium]